MAMQTLIFEYNVEQLPRPMRRRVERAVVEATAADRRWFEENPRRRTYVRQPVNNEVLEAQHRELWFVAVRQLHRGVRMRWPFRWFGPPPSERILRSEEFADTVFELCAENPGKFNSGDAIRKLLFSKILATATPAGTS